MDRKRAVIGLVVCLLLISGILTVQAAGIVDQKTVLSGEVVMVVPIGTVVQEGAELVRVSTLAGSTTAARANLQGVVTAVLVDVGSMIKSGDIVVRIEVQP